jgi:hypothetical protein
MEDYNRIESITAQKKYCDEKGAPHFAPKSGVCWKCRQDIYSPVEKTRILFWKPGKPEEKYFTGITTEKAATVLVTGCPHCNISYCD